MVQVKVRADGFKYDGQVDASLSATAKAVIGSHCNGFVLKSLPRERLPVDSASSPASCGPCGLYEILSARHEKISALIRPPRQDNGVRDARHGITPRHRVC